MMKRIIKWTGRTALSFIKKIESGKMPLTDENLKKYYEACLHPQDDLKSGYFRYSPSFTPKVKQAIYLARENHCRNMNDRAGSQLVAHLLRVNRILSFYAKAREVSEDLSIACILHRIGECRNYPKESCKDFFGWNVSQTVYDFPKMFLLGEMDEENEAAETFRWRHEITSFLYKASEAHYNGVMILCAAQIDRLGFFVRFYPSKGDKIWEDAGISKENQMWFYDKTVEIISMKIDDKMVLEMVEGLKETMNKAIQIFSKSIHQVA